MHRYAVLSKPVAWLARRPGEPRLDQGYRALVAAVVLLFPGLCLLVDRSDSVSLLLLGAVGVLVWIRDGFKSNLSRDDWLLVGAFYAFFLSALLSFEFGHQTSEGFRLLGRYLRFLFVLPILIALRRYRPPVMVLWTGLGLGCLLVGMDALWEFVVGFGEVRPAGDTGVAILFGDLSMLTGFAFAAGYLYLSTRVPHAGLLVATYALIALLACFLSGSRGAWLAVPMLLLLFFAQHHLLTLRRVFIGSGAVLALFAVLLVLPRTDLLERARSLVTESWAYIELQGFPPYRSGNPLCLDQPEVLRSWLDGSNAPQPQELDLQVVTLSSPDVQSLRGTRCRHASAIRINNHSAEIAWMQLPRYQTPKERVASTQLMVKGQGYIEFANQPGTASRIEHPGFTPVELTAPAKYGSALWLGVGPHAALWLLPLESYSGEYRYGVLETPVGLRLEMWATALRLFRGAPLLGVGTGAYQFSIRNLVTKGKVAPYAADFDHPHSDYLEALSSRGLVGLAALLLLLSVPGWLYWKKLDNKDPQVMSAALGGLVVIVGIVVCALTETLFIHSIVIGWYVMVTVGLFSTAINTD